MFELVNKDSGGVSIKPINLLLICWESLVRLYQAGQRLLLVISPLTGCQSEVAFTVSWIVLLQVLLWRKEKSFYSTFTSRLPFQEFFLWNLHSRFFHNFTFFSFCIIDNTFSGWVCSGHLLHILWDGLVRHEMVLFKHFWVVTWWCNFCVAKLHTFSSFICM